jgi:hypothetical protein
VVSNTSFGKNILTNNFDPAIVSGWGIRPSDWNLTASIEHEILPRTSIRVAYVRRSFHGFSVVDNRALADSDLTPFSIVAPRDPRLPNGGGYVIPGLYDVVPDKSGQVDNFVTHSSKYGAWTQYFNGSTSLPACDARASRSPAAPARARPSQTTAMCAGDCRSLPPPQPERARSARVCSRPP